MFRLLQPIIIIGSGILAGLIIKHWVIAWLHTFTRRFAWEGNERILNAVSQAVLLWCTLVGVYIAVPFVPLNANLSGYLQNTLLILFVLSFTITLVRISTDLIMLYSGQGNISSLSLFKNIASIGIVLVGILTILSLLGVPIGPSLAALGVGGIAVSLAMQDTLKNLLAGIQLLVDRQINIGDYVRLAGGEEGYVNDISWRTTQIRQLSNNLIIIPNASLAQATIINYSRPEKELSVLFDVGVSYESDLELVERVTIEVAKEVMQAIEGAVPDNEPFIRYNAFSNSSINFTVILRVQEFVHQYTIKHECIKRLAKRYREEGIEVPLPIQTIHLKNDAGADGEEEEDSLL